MGFVEEKVDTLSSQMPHPKLFLYKAADAPVAVLLRRGLKRTDWEMIRWNLETDTFLAGQWLTKKQVYGKYCAISPNGRYFGYQYDQYTKGYTSCAVVSEIPNFTALLYCPKNTGCCDSIGFTAKNEVVYSQKSDLWNGNPWDVKSSAAPFVNERGTCAPSGFVEEVVWIDPRGRRIELRGAQIIADGDVLYDTTDHAFLAREPIHPDTVRRSTRVKQPIVVSP